MNAEALQLPDLGEVIGEGRFELVRQLGDGGMSTVFVAVDHFLGREVALKLLTPRYVGRPEREQRLVNEAEYLRRVQGHRNIVELIDSGRLRDRDGWPWLTTEILHGEVLARLFIHGKIELPRVIAIARQIAFALDACHAAGVVHRDVTPNNVYMLEDWQTAKLFDFSHAADLQAPKVAAGAPQRLTGVFDTPGTIGYMGPEQVHNAPPDASMDAFGFGVLLFKLVTGRSPYRQFTDRDEFIRAQREGTLEPPRLHAWAYDAPDDLAELVHDCTQRDNEKRPSMAEVVSRLDALELPPVQEDDATSFYRASAVSVSRRAPEHETTEAHITTGFEPPHATSDAGQAEPDVTERVDAPALLRSRHSSAPPDAIGDWVVANQLARPEFEERRNAEHLPAQAPTVQPYPEPLLAFARPPGQRLPLPTEVVEPTSPPVELAHTDVPAPTIDEVDPEPTGARGQRVLVLGLLALALLVVGWLAADRQAGNPADRAHRDPPSDTEEDAPPNEPDPTPPPQVEPGPALEPMPEVEPVEDSAPEPEPKSKPNPKPKHEHKLNSPDAEPAASCEGVQQKARAAEDKADWRQVASLTARKECWSSPKERASLRLRAMYELGNWKECVSLGDKADPSVQKYVEQCQSLAK